ncbi:MAG: hypothetical protein JOY90_02825 [Bradyrhizobium sp.]|nr:hypothetical protein [Bradyrhizobium sp.]MBV9559386.1 hypothetical protein [Bradyrhizobium sp.]
MTADSPVDLLDTVAGRMAVLCLSAAVVPLVIFNLVMLVRSTKKEGKQC